MIVAQGDVVIVAFPFASGTASKERPALVIQADRWNKSIANTIVAQITGRTPPSGVDTVVAINPSTADGASSGLWKPSWISCTNVVTIEQTAIRRVVGHISPVLMAHVRDALKSALAIV